MFDKAAAARVVVAFCGGSAAETLAKLGNEALAECVKAGLCDGFAEALYFRVIAVLFLADDGITCKECVYESSSHRQNLMSRASMP